MIHQEQYKKQKSERRPTAEHHNFVASDATEICPHHDMQECCPDYTLAIIMYFTSRNVLILVGIHKWHLNLVLKIFLFQVKRILNSFNIADDICYSSC